MAGQVEAQPRLPRGISRIPHLVTMRQQQQQQQCQMSDANRYLTFSKEQASNHFRSLRDELSMISNSFDGDHHDHTFEQSIESAEYRPPTLQPEQQPAIQTPPTPPKPLKRQSKQQGQNAPRLLSQQPICEAFIMTGESMLKVSCNESEDGLLSVVGKRTSDLASSMSATLEEEEPAVRGRSYDQLSNGLQHQQQNQRSHKPAQEELPTQIEDALSLNQTSVSSQYTQTGRESLFLACSPAGNKSHLDGRFSRSLSREGSGAIITDSPSPEEPVSVTPPPEPSGSVEGTHCPSSEMKLEQQNKLPNPPNQDDGDDNLLQFDFRCMKLDAAIRKFLANSHLTGETQERERILAGFSERYFECNKDKFPSAAVVQTLVCALVLLNTDLHGTKHERSKRPKIPLAAFIEGLQSSLAEQRVHSSDTTIDASNLYTFPRHLLVELYESIKKRPLKYPDQRLSPEILESELDRLYRQQISANRANTLPTRRFAPGSNAPSSTMNLSSRRQFKNGMSKLNGFNSDSKETCIEFRSGILVRKRIIEPSGRPTPKGRRGWRYVQAILNDLRLIMQPISAAEASSKSSTPSKGKPVKLCQDIKNTLNIHHAFANKAISYKKRQYVFHLRLADHSELLLQAKDERDMIAWLDTINFAAACMSSPALPNAICNSSKGGQTNIRFQRPTLSAALTKLSYWEQLIDHEERLQNLKQELDNHLTKAPQTKTANKRSKTIFIERIADLRQDIERQTVYVDLMRKKSNSPEAIILSKHPQIASFTPSEEIQTLTGSESPKKFRPALTMSTGQQVSDL